MEFEIGSFLEFGIWDLEFFFMLAAMRILVVEDDTKIASFVVNGLKQSGFAVDLCSDGVEGLSRAQAIAIRRRQSWKAK